MKKKHEQSKEQKEQEVPVIRELPCYNCHGFLHTILGFLFSGQLLYQCQSCGCVNCLGLGAVNGKQIPQSLKKNVSPSYFG